MKNLDKLQEEIFKDNSYSRIKDQFQKCGCLIVGGLIGKLCPKHFKRIQELYN